MQPNFEKIKAALYNKVSNSNQAAFMELFDTIKGVKKDSYYMPKRVQDRMNEFNKILDTLDIRLVPQLIKMCNKKSLPNWMVKGHYIIDYNEHGFLDLIRK